MPAANRRKGCGHAGHRRLACCGRARARPRTARHQHRRADAAERGGVLDARAAAAAAARQLAGGRDRGEGDREGRRERRRQPEPVQAAARPARWAGPRPPGLPPGESAVPPAAPAAAPPGNRSGDGRRALRVAEQEDRRAAVSGQPDAGRPPAEVGRASAREPATAETPTRRSRTGPPRGAGAAASGLSGSPSKNAVVLRSGSPSASIGRPVAPAARPGDRPRKLSAYDGERPATRTARRDDHPVVAGQVHPCQPLPGEQVDDDHADADREQRPSAAAPAAAAPRRSRRATSGKPGPVARRGQHELGGVHDPERDQQDPQRLGPASPTSSGPSGTPRRPAPSGPRHLLPLRVGRPEAPAPVVPGHLAARARWRASTRAGCR